MIRQACHIGRNGAVERNDLARRRVVSALCALRCEQEGSSLIELALVSSLLVLLFAGSVDLGRAGFAAIEVWAAANSGAVYGTQNPTNTAGMRMVALLAAADLNGLTSSASRGCACSDGSASSSFCTVTPGCSTTTVKYVIVTTSMTYMPSLGFPRIPTSLALKGSARLRAVN
ncbi:MAG: TadE/TadG family type IV pilus assembly protein [Janthinobacterium lividum]